MKSRWDAGQFKLKGKKWLPLACKCCVIIDFREGNTNKFYKEEVEDYLLEKENYDNFINSNISDSFRYGCRE